jgi:alpha-N-acetylglucosamine transferase
MPKSIVARKSPSSKTRRSLSLSSGAGGKTQQKILDVAAILTKKYGKKEVSRKKVSMFGGNPASSTFANALTKLKKDGDITFTGQTIVVTSRGMSKACTDLSDISIPLTNKELQDSLKDQYKLNEKSRMLMDQLADGLSHQKVDVAKAIGCIINSTFSNMMTNLKILEIVDFDRTTIKLTDAMFEVECRP